MRISSSGDKSDFENFFSNEMPTFLQEIKQECGEVLHAKVNTLLHKAKLVTREEYDIQVLLLRRLTDKVAELEKKLASFSVE